MVRGMMAVTLAVLAWGAAPARAEILQLTYDGFFNSFDTLNGVALGTTTPFMAQAVFDSSVSTTLEPGAAQFRTLSFSLALGGVTYGVTASAADPLNAQGVVFFDLSGPDANSPSYQGTPHYGVGFFSLGNGNTGIIGDWTAATAPATVAQPGSAVFSNFYGVGYNPGTLTLTAPDGTAGALVLNEGANGNLADYNSGDPGLVFAGANAGQPVIADNAVQILQVPEPAAAAVLGMGLLSLAVLRRRR
jgi:hypothetical protein